MPVAGTTTSRLLEELQMARAESDRLFDILSPEGLYSRPIAQRHRVIFYVGHLDGFDAIQVCREALGMSSPDEELDRLFQAGIDPDGDNLPKDRPSDWPTIQQVRAYADRCRARVDENVERVPEEIVYMMLEHRLMHLETLAYMFHNFSYDLKRMPVGAQIESTNRTSPENAWCDVPAGEAKLGRPRGTSFGWDNEYDEYRVQVPAFRVQKYKVTNGEYLRFVEDGAPLPNFWIRRDGELFYRGMFQEILLPLDWPVYVKQDEAAAYAQWAGKSLLSEEQFHRAAYGTSSGRNREYPWGNTEPTPQRGNFDFRRWDPEPVDATPAGDSEWGVSQLLGNGWEWTNTIFAPFPGFIPRPSYPGYSANFFDGEHNVIKGASPRTSARLFRSSFRNWFRRDYPYVYATFRCVENQGR